MDSELIKKNNMEKPICPKCKNPDLEPVLRNKKIKGFECYNCCSYFDKERFE